MHKNFYAAFSPLLYYYQFSWFLKTYNEPSVFLYFQQLNNVELVCLSFMSPAPIMGSSFLFWPFKIAWHLSCRSLLLLYYLRINRLPEARLRDQRIEFFLKTWIPVTKQITFQRGGSRVTSHRQCVRVPLSPAHGAWQVSLSHLGF